jgi:hypothetical protein
MSRLSIASIIFVSLAIAGASDAEPATIAVPANGDLHAALLNAQPGDTITLAPGATYVGNFTLPAKSGDAFITIRSASFDPVPAGARISPGHKTVMATLKTPNSSPAIQTAPGAHHWRLVLLEIQGSNDNDLVALGNGSASQSSLSQVPHDIQIDRCYIHGDPSTGQKRCVALNSAATTVTGSYIADCKRVGVDSQAIAGWNGPGPYTIDNNYLEGSTENIMFGGSDPSIQGLVPSDIVISDNMISKPVEWRKEKWQVKNIVELKNARRVRITGNVIQNIWVAAQSGYGVLFTVRNQNGKCPWCQVENVTFENNILRHCAGGISVLGYDDVNPSQQTQNITIRNNLLFDIDSTNWGGSGYAFQIVGGPRQITIDHNTIIQEHASGFVLADGQPILEFVFTNNLTRHNAYGVIGRNHGPGNDTISAFFPGSRFTSNVIADGAARSYPGGNKFPSTAEFRAQFANYDGGDFRLTASSGWKRASSDGMDLGANVGAIASVNEREIGEPRRPLKP